MKKIGAKVLIIGLGCVGEVTAYTDEGMYSSFDVEYFDKKQNYKIIRSFFRNQIALIS